MKYINYFTGLLVSLVGVLAPTTPIILSVVFLIFCDFIFGLYRSYKTGQEITSRKMSQTLPKIFLYNLVIIALFLSNKFVIETGLPLEKIAASLICLVELRSIDESWKMIYGWSIWDKVTESVNRGKNSNKSIEGK
jgi:hypothetical protein